MAAAAIFFGTLGLYWATTGHGYVLLDDDRYVFDNPAITGGLRWEGIRAAFGEMQENLWIPATGLSYMLDVEWNGLDPFGFHATNALLHALNAALAFWLLRRWTGNGWAAAAGALVWAWHPLRAESVAWISCRKDVLSGAYFLLSLAAYERWASGGARARRWRWGSAALLGLGLASKSTLMATPAVLLLMDVWPLKRVAPEWGDLRKKGPGLVAEKWPHWGLCAAAGALSVLGHEAAGSLRETGAWERLGRAAMNAAFYLWKTIAPRNLSVLYEDLEATALGAGMALLMLAAATWGAWRTRRKLPGVAAGWLWYLALLAPASGIVAFGAQSRADRYTYLPALGLSVAMACGLAGLRKGKKAWVAAVAALLAGLAAATHGQLGIWKNTETLLGRAMEASPSHPVVLLNYAVSKYDEGDIEEAERLMRRALDAEMANRTERTICAGNLGYVLAMQGRAEEAREALRRGMGDEHRHWTVPTAWGMALLHEGKAEEAIPHLLDGLARRPGDERIMGELQRAQIEAGREEDVRRLAEALRGPGGRPAASYDALFPHYLTQWRKGGRRYAWGYFERLAGMEYGRSVQMLNNVAWLAATDERTPPDVAAKAAAFAERAAEYTHGENAAVLDTLGAARAAAGDFAGALEAGERALALAGTKQDAKLQEEIRGRLGLYRAGKPYRERAGE